MDGKTMRRRGGAGTGRRVTMTDIAQEAGCSQTTVSFVLNRTEGVKISAQTRERVIEVARARGYSLGNFVDLIPASESRKIDGLIAFAVDQLATSPEAVVAIEGARQAAWGPGNIILVAQTMSDPVMEPRTIAALLGQGVQAFIYMTIFTREVTVPPQLYGLDIPVILLNCYTRDHAFPAVVPSEIAGGQSATHHLIELGHRRIACITGEMWMEAAQDRLEGYRRALATADIVFDPSLVVEGDWSASAGYKGTRQLLALRDRPTAIFCQNDRTAIGCFEALKEAELRIPEDISVVGYDDEEISRHLHPRLTTSILPHRAMGQWAIERLAKPFDPSHTRHPITKLECPLMIRDSSSPPNSANSPLGATRRDRPADRK